MHRVLPILALALAVSACAPTPEAYDAGFYEASDGAESLSAETRAEFGLGTGALHTVVGQSRHEVEAGSHLFLYLLSDEGTDLESYSVQSFMACDADDLYIEHDISGFTAALPDALVDTAVEDGLVDSVIPELGTLSGLSLFVAETARTNDQILLGPNIEDLFFDIVVHD